MISVRDVGVLGIGLWDGPVVTNEAFVAHPPPKGTTDPYKGRQSTDGSIRIAGLVLRPDKHARTLAALRAGFEDPYRGTRARRIAPPEIEVSDMEADAARRALADSGLAAEDVDVLLVQSFLSDELQPRNSAIVAHKLGITRAASWEVDSICNSTVSQLQVAAAFVASGMARVVLCVQSVAYSRVRDPGASASFQEGDLASAFVVGHKPGAALTFAWRTDGSLHAAIRLAWDKPTGAPIRKFLQPSQERVLIRWNDELQQRVMTEVEQRARSLCDEVLTRADTSMGDIDVFVTHQPMNWFGAFMEDVLGLRDGVSFGTFDTYANVNSASVTASLHDGVRAGRIAAGRRVLIFCPGAGYTYAAAVIQW